MEIPSVCARVFGCVPCLRVCVHASLIVVYAFAARIHFYYTYFGNGLHKLFSKSHQYIRTCKCARAPFITRISFQIIFSRRFILFYSFYAIPSNVYGKVHSLFIYCLLSLMWTKRLSFLLLSFCFEYSIFLANMPSPITDGEEMMRMYIIVFISISATPSFPIIPPLYRSLSHTLSSWLCTCVITHTGTNKTTNDCRSRSRRVIILCAISEEFEFFCAMRSKQS